MVEADESDGTHLRAAAVRDHPDQRGGRPPRPLRQLRRHRRLLRPVPRRGSTGPKVLCLDDPVTARLAAAHEVITYGTHPDADVRATAIETAEGVAAVHRAPARRASSARSTLPLRGMHNVRNAFGAIAMADAVGVPLRRRGPRPWRASAASPGASTSGGSTTASRSSTTTRTSRTEIAAVLEAAATSGDGWSRIVAVFQPNRYNRMAVLSPDYRDAFVARRPGGDHRHLPVGPGAAARGHRQARGRRGLRRAPGTAGGRGCPSGPTWWRSWWASCVPVTSASRWAAATSPRCRTRSCAAPAASGAGRERVIDEAASMLGRPSRAGRAPRPAHDLPGRRPRRRCWCGSTDIADLVAVRSCRGRHGPARADRRAGARTCWWPTVASGDWPSSSGPFAPSVDVDGTTVTAGGAVSLPVLARQTVAAGLTGLEWAVGVPGSVGGGVRMNAGGHGSDMASVAGGGPRVRPAQRRGWCGADERSGPAIPGFRPRRPPGRGVGALRAGATAIAAASEAELAEIVRWRREHQPGGQNAGSVFVNPVPGRAVRR